MVLRIDNAESKYLTVDEHTILVVDSIVSEVGHLEESGANGAEKSLDTKASIVEHKFLKGSTRRAPGL